MSYGLMSVGSGMLDQSKNLLGRSADMERERNQFNTSLDMADKAAKVQGIGTGAGIGASVAAANVAGTAGGMAGMYGAGGMAAVGMGVAAPIAIGAIAAYALMELF